MLPHDFAPGKLLSCNARNLRAFYAASWRVGVFWRQISGNAGRALLLPRVNFKQRMSSSTACGQKLMGSQT